MPDAAYSDRAASFAPLESAAAAERWSRFGQWDEPFFPSHLGLQLEEVREGYARMRLPYGPELRQPAGIVHGGAVATLIDTVVVPALAASSEVELFMATIDMQIRYLNAARETDLVAEGWVVRRGKTVSYCQAEVRRANDGEVVAEGWLVYTVSPMRA